MTGLDARFRTVSCNPLIPPDCGPTTPDQASSGSRRNENPCQDALSRAVHGQLAISAFWQLNRHGLAFQTEFQSRLAGFALCLALCQNGGGQLSGLFLGFCRFQSWNPIPRRTSMTGSAISPIAISIVFPASPAFPVPDTVRTTSSVLDVSRPARPPLRASSPYETIDRRRPAAICAEDTENRNREYVSSGTPSGFPSSHGWLEPFRAPCQADLPGVPFLLRSCVRY